MSLSAEQSARLDGLRGLAALIVVASHASGLGMDFVPGLSLAGIGKHGVYLFFVISAFLLTAQWLVQLERGDSGVWHWLYRYFVRRVMRIYPLYLLVLTVGLLLGGKGLGVPMDTSVWLAHVLLLDGRELYWSIPVEFKYYLVIPVLAWWWSRPVALALRMGVTVAALGLLLFFYPGSATQMNSIVLGFYLPTFVAGSLAAWWWSARGKGQPVVQRPSMFVLDAALLLALVLTIPAVARFWDASVQADFLHRAYIFWGGLWSLVAVAVMRGWLPAWGCLLVTAPMRHCGAWCFGIYLLHMPCLYLAKRLSVPLALKAWLALILALLLAWLAHRFIEKPALSLGRRLSAR